MTVLRFRAVCESCRSKLPPRSEAWFDEESRTAMCVTCHRLHGAPGGSGAAADLAAPTASPPSATPSTPSTPAVTPPAPAPAAAAAGSSGPVPFDGPLRFDGPLPTFDPKPRPRIASMSRSLPVVGPSLAAELEASGRLPAPPDRPPASTAAVGPARPAPMGGPADADGPAPDMGFIARALEVARPQGIDIIRSRPWGGTKVDTEDLVIAPSGVWVVDGLASSTGPIERSFLSGHAGADLLNVVGGRTSVVSGLLHDSPFHNVPVRGALCFDAQPPSWFDEAFYLAGILVSDTRRLVDAFFSPLQVDAETRAAITTHLTARL